MPVLEVLLVTMAGTIAAAWLGGLKVEIERIRRVIGHCAALRHAQIQTSLPDVKDSQIARWARDHGRQMGENDFFLNGRCVAHGRYFEF